MDILWLISILFSLLLGILSLLTIKNRKYFTHRGITYLGDMIYPMIFHNLNLAGHSLYWYKKARDQNLKLAGLTELLTPTIIITDPDLIKAMMVKDAEYFVDRRIYQVSNRDYLFKTSLPIINGDHWKFLRGKISPTFTAAKIRRIFNIFDTSSKKLVSYLEQETKNCEQTDLAKAYDKFTADVIASAAFGLESQAFDQKEPSEFQTMTQKLQIGVKGLEVLKFMFMEIFPAKLSEVLGFSFFSLEVQDYFSQIIQRVIKHRQESGEKREDFVQILLEAKEEKLIQKEVKTTDFKNEAELKSADSKNKFTFSDNDITTQCTGFIVAGLDSLNSGLIFSAYVLALNPDVQNRLYNEISSNLEQTGGEFTYESLQKMEYLDMVTTETMRLYSPTLLINRACTKDYKVPDSNITIKKGEAVIISTLGMHRDKDNFEDPESFDPERWTAENRSKIHPYAFLPFGHGPRSCPGMRFGVTHVKLAVAHLVHNFIIEPCKQTPTELKFISSINLQPEGGMWLTLRKRM